MKDIAKNIKKYYFNNDGLKYVINNFDYLTTEYHIASDEYVDASGVYVLMKRVIDLMDKNKVVIDIGGNCGLTSIPFCLNGYEVYTFEPIKMNVDLIEMNKIENKCDNLTIIPYALSDKTKDEIIYVPYCSDNTSFNKNVAVSNMRDKTICFEETVKCITFDEWLENNEPINIGFIKIDVQGHEKNVLDGMVKFLSNCNDVYLFIEWDEKHTTMSGSTLKEMGSLLNSAGFKEKTIFDVNLHGDKIFYKK
jgi:FkbM family methyltransferase